MSRYSIQYQEDHSIDWYAKFNDRYYHFASGGSYLPKEANDKQKNRAIQQYLANANDRDIAIDQVSLINEKYFEDIVMIVRRINEQQHVDIIRELSIGALDALYSGLDSYCFWGYDKWGGIIYRLIAKSKNKVPEELEGNCSIPVLANGLILTSMDGEPEFIVVYP